MYILNHILCGGGGGYTSCCVVRGIQHILLFGYAASNGYILLYLVLLRFTVI